MADLANSGVFIERNITPKKKIKKAMVSRGVYEACSKRAQALPLTYGEMRSALEWVDLGNRDFISVCIFAGYDPAYIYRKAKGLIRKYEKDM